MRTRPKGVKEQRPFDTPQADKAFGVWRRWVALHRERGHDGPSAFCRECYDDARKEGE